MNRLEHALHLASLGFLISPLRPGTKLPYKGESWQKMQTTDPAVIRAWFESRPDMNYAVNPGQHGVILDPDEDKTKGKQGLRQLEQLEAENFEDDPIIGQTLTVRTPRGGRHLYLATDFPVSNRDGGFPSDIDVRGAGGYVVGPGSVTVAVSESTAAGEYVVECDKPVAKAPQWVMTRLDQARERDANAGEVIGDLDSDTQVERVRGLIQSQTKWPTEGQGGDAATYEFIALARNYGAVSQDKMFELLTEPFQRPGEPEMESWNDRCMPPWDVGDLTRKIENAYTYATSAAGSKGGLLDSLEMEGAQFIDPGDAQRDEQVQAFKSKLEGMYFPGDTLRERPNRREYIIDQWMLAHGMTQLLAFRSTGKSIVMIDLCLRLACDMDWFDYKSAEGWAVVYCCGEDDEGMQAQMDAWYAEHKVRPRQDRFIVMTGVPNLSDPAECAEWVKFLKDKLKGRRAILAIDTWQRATSRASQNDDEQMNIATDMVDAMAEALGGPSLIAFHPPKGNVETISGSMLIENKGSAIWKMSADAVVKKIVVDRIKGKGRGNFLKVFFNEVELPYKDQWGNPSTAIVVAKAGDIHGDSIELKACNDKAKALWAQIVYDILLEADRETPPPKADQKDVAMRVFAWRDKHPNDPSVRELTRLNEQIPTSITGIQRRLKTIFLCDGPVVVCQDGVNCIHVERAKGGGSAQKYIYYDLESYREEHPDKFQPIIPPVETEAAPDKEFVF